MGGDGAVTRARLAVCVAALLAAGATIGRATSQSALDVTAVLAQVGERVAGYYRRATSIVCIETATVQPIQTNWTAEGMARTVESELRVEAGATLRREIRRVNGREPRDRDKKDRAGCTDPDPLSEEPLAFLLPGADGPYTFTAVRAGRERNRPALVIDFLSTNQKTRAELVEDKRGHDDCFDWTGPIATRGQVWVDAATHDVLRVDRRNSGPVDLRVSWKLQRRHNLDAFFVLDRDDLSLRYKEVAFKDPDETLMLPDSIVSTTIVRSGLQSTRRTTTFSGYRRFLTTGRIR
jgi:hypothetical protein